MANFWFYQKKAIPAFPNKRQENITHKNIMKQDFNTLSTVASAKHACDPNLIPNLM